MKKIAMTCLVRYLAFALFLAPYNVQAVEETIAIEEILVVSSRTERSVMDVPAAVSVVNQADIQQGRQLLGLDESLNRVPGVFSQNRYNFAQDLRVSVRGFGARANFGIRGLKIYVDDIPATTADGQSGVDDIDLGSLQRIEVTRGPSASLYGASAGGVLNLFSEDGGEPSFVEAHATVGEDGQRRYQLKGAGQHGRLAHLVSLTDLSYDGYRDHAEVESTLLNSKFRYSFDDGGELTFIVNLVDSPTADDAGAITAAQVDADPTQAQPRNLSSNAGEELDQQKLGWVYRRGFGDGHEFKVRNYYVWRDFEAFLPIGTHIPFVSDDGVVEFDRFFYGGGFQVLFNGELFGRPSQTIVGVDIDRQEDDRQRFLNNAGSKGALAFDQVEEAESYGVFLRNELALTDRLTFIVGLRYDEVELSVDDKFLANDDQSSELDFDEVSPMAGMVWALSDDLSLYANYSTSFETPTFTELAAPARSLSVGLGGFNNVSAQEARSFEVGVKSSLWSNRLYVDAALYSMDVEDEITNVENIGNRSTFENADTERKGVELTAIAQLSETVRVSLAYTYSDFEFDSFASNPEFAGNDLPGLPEQQFYAEVAYRPHSGFYAVADVLYVDDLHANNANSVVTDSSVVANVRAGFVSNHGSWQITPFVGVNNLFDEEYLSNVRINGFGGRLFEPGPELNFYGGISVRRVTR
jgi:iron complex outermembrane receptor protein